MNLNALISAKMAGFTEFAVGCAAPFCPIDQVGENQLIASSNRSFNFLGFLTVDNLLLSIGKGLETNVANIVHY